MQSNVSLDMGSGSRIRPYASSKHNVTKGRYITSNDPRGYIPVYEYPLNGQWIMMDIDDGYVLWTGIWKALGNSKADIVKLVDSQPDLAPLVRRVRGGYLKIQGTWLPFETALKLARRVAYSIREDLVPLFGPTFVHSCLNPDQAGYGQLFPSRRGRRAVAKKPSYVTMRPTSSSSVGSADQASRYSAINLLPEHPHQVDGSRLALPPVQMRDDRSNFYQPSSSSYALPPISALEDMRGMQANDSKAVLRRLIEDDNHERRQRCAPEFHPHQSLDKDNGNSPFDRTPYGSYPPRLQSSGMSSGESSPELSRQLPLLNRPLSYHASASHNSSRHPYQQRRQSSDSNAETSSSKSSKRSYVDSHGNHRLAPTL